MACSECQHLIDEPNSVHTLRTCGACGRQMRVVVPGKHGIGISMRAGDQIVIPAGTIRFSLDPRRATGSFTRAGISWFAAQLFIGPLPIESGSLATAIEEMSRQCNETLQQSELLRNFDLKNEAELTAAAELIQREHPNTVEHFAFLELCQLTLASDNIQRNNANEAARAMACAERFRSMIIFKQQMEDVLWMGHSARRLLDALSTWHRNRKNDEEEFWQITLSENSFVLSQVFAAPIVVIQERAYVGGTEITGKGGKHVDFFATSESSNEAVLIEIKSPVTNLLGPKYRPGVFGPSKELSGCVVQALNYKSRSIETYGSQGLVDGKPVGAVNPRCVVIIGDAETQLASQERRRSFELFRAGLKDVEVVTYDELFRKVEVLAGLFNLVNTKK